jgi:hypothetical protein
VGVTWDYFDSIQCSLFDRSIVLSSFIDRKKGCLLFISRLCIG